MTPPISLSRRVFVYSEQVRTELIALFPPPAMIIIQLGSNDLGACQSINSKYRRTYSLAAECFYGPLYIIQVNVYPYIRQVGSMESIKILFSSTDIWVMDYTVTVIVNKFINGKIVDRKSFLNTQNPGTSELIALFPPPAMIIIQLGSNDLGTCQSIDLIQNIEKDILWLRLLLPKAVSVN
jgi:hypothetical protein